MSTKVTLNVEWTRSDVREVVLYILFRRLGWPIAAVSVYPVFSELIPFLYSGYGTGRPLDWTWDHPLKPLVVAPVVAVVCSVMVWLRVTRQWLKNPVTREKKAYVFSEEGIALTSPSADSTAAWDLVNKARLGTGSVYVFMKLGGYHFIPSHAIDDVAKREDLMELLRAHVANRNF